jgi:hypothetical protein
VEVDVSDLARVYASGHELALGGQNLAVVYPPGKELATVANAGLAVAPSPGHELAR